jgi:hypothetical protein
MTDDKPSNPRGRLIGPAFKRGWFVERTQKAGGRPEVRRETLHGMLAAVFGEGALRAPEAFDDEYYYLPLLAEAQTVFDFRSLADRNAWGEVLDCEDFAYWLRSDFAFNRYQNADSNTLMPFATGILWGRLDGARHTLNVVVTFDRGVCLMDSMPGNTRVAARSAWSTMGADHIVI